ncbi:MAG: BrnT family toxin [Synergistaceae bacterium]|nr:BrnT family toxin [Synergistaceae bacterium]
MNDDIKFEFEGMSFTWDDNKAAVNWKKHKVTFKRAAEVFADEYAIDVFDLEHKRRRRQAKYHRQNYSRKHIVCGVR